MVSGLRIVLAISALILCEGYVCASQTFVISFQKSGGWSRKEWAEIDTPKKVLNEFTACHWEKIRYFSSDSMTLKHVNSKASMVFKQENIQFVSHVN